MTAFVARRSSNQIKPNGIGSPDRGQTMLAVGGGLRQACRKNLTRTINVLGCRRLAFPTASSGESREGTEGHDESRQAQRAPPRACCAFSSPFRACSTANALQVSNMPRIHQQISCACQRRFSCSMFRRSPSVITSSRNSNRYALTLEACDLVQYSRSRSL